MNRDRRNLLSLIFLSPILSLLALGTAKAIPADPNVLHLNDSLGTHRLTPSFTGTWAGSTEVRDDALSAELTLTDEFGTQPLVRSGTTHSISGVSYVWNEALYVFVLNKTPFYRASQYVAR